MRRGAQTGLGRRSILVVDGRLASGKPYAERVEAAPGWHDRLADYLLSRLVEPVWHRLRNPIHSVRGIVDEVRSHEAALRTLSDAALAGRVKALRIRLRRDGFARPAVGEGFALVSEAAFRTVGYRHFPSQFMAGWALLSGRLVEMETGEGKTFAATLPASIVALAGYPVHVITVNDYLAERDAHEMGPLYDYLGLSVGAVTQKMDREARRSAYAQAITYCTNKDLAFDYLRDGVAFAGRSSRLHLAIDRLRGDTAAPPDMVLRGLCYAIVDEADSVFIDEARTPLILSARSGAPGETPIYQQALELAGQLREGEDYKIERALRIVELEDAGRDRLAALCEGMGGVWTSIRGREELIERALSAILLFHRDQHYVVADGAVQIVDESTGRVMPDRSWERGMHQLIEVKEGCDPSEKNETLARITYQRLFRRYIRLSGMTGTAKEVAREIRAVYTLRVIRIPLHRPSQRRYLKPRVCLTAEEKWDLVVEVVRRLAVEQGRPVLIGTRSVAASERISAILHGFGIDHALLNARQDSQEADIIARAGQPGQVTVATNMAGRGTDIRLGPGVEARGGLHVILTEFHESRRIDRQLYGRAARQGDRGSCEAIVSLEDEVYAVNVPRFTAIVRRWKALRMPGSRMLCGVLRWMAQRSAEKRGALARIENLRTDGRLDQVLAFSGRRE